MPDVVYATLGGAVRAGIWAWRGYRLGDPATRGVDRVPQMKWTLSWWCYWECRYCHWESRPDVAAAGGADRVLRMWKRVWACREMPPLEIAGEAVCWAVPWRMRAWGAGGGSQEMRQVMREWAWAATEGQNATNMVGLLVRPLVKWAH